MFALIPALLAAYGVILLITGKPAFFRGGHRSVASMYYEPSIWMRFAGFGFVLIVMIHMTAKWAPVWFFLPVPLVLFIIGLFNTGGKVR